jgi:hypothetical protein
MRFESASRKKMTRRENRSDNTDVLPAYDEVRPEVSSGHNGKSQVFAKTT